MHSCGLFDHGPVFSVVVQIIFQTGWAIACGMEVRYLLNERKTTRDCRTTVGTTASCRSHRNVTDTGRLQATRTSRDYCDKKSCRCFSTRGEGEGGGDGAKLVPAFASTDGKTKGPEG